MFDGLYFWNLIWSFFTLLSLVFVPVLFVMIYLNTRGPGPVPARQQGLRPLPGEQGPEQSRSTPGSGPHEPGVASRGPCGPLRRRALRGPDLWVSRDGRSRR